MRMSIIIPVLNSHEVVRRQALHWRRIGLPEGVEIVLVDDGSQPPLPGAEELGVPGLRVLRTYDYRPWTWALARNAGARASEADYYLMLDLDHILTRQAIDDAAAFDGDRMQFKREFGVLDEGGELRTDYDTLLAYGLEPGRRRLGPHPNNFCISRRWFWELGGYREDLFSRPYPQGEDADFKRKWHKVVEAGLGANGVHRPTLYMFPNGKYCGDVDFNPGGLFHDLSRKSRRNPFYKEAARG